MKKADISDAIRKIITNGMRYIFQIVFSALSGTVTHEFGDVKDLRKLTGHCDHTFFNDIRIIAKHIKKRNRYNSVK